MPLFDELLVKVAEGKELSPPELSAFRLEARKLNQIKEAVGSWFPPGSSGANPRFDQIYAQGGRFAVVPLSMLHLEVFGDVVQVIPNNTTTPVNFDTVQGHPNSLRWDENDPTKIFSLDTSKKYAFIGSVQWEAHATGRRGIHIEAFNKDGVSQWGQTLHSLKPTGTNSDTMPFASGLVGFTFESAYFKVTVVQTSGGALDLEELHCTIFEVY